MPGKKRAKRRSKFLLFALFLAALALIAIVLVVILIIGILRPGPLGPGPDEPTPTEPRERPDSQPADCPDVLTVVIPGTWESSADDDPTTPSANPNSLMLRVSNALQGEFDAARTEVHTVPYIAEFRNPANLGDRQTDYNTSRTQGYNRAAGKIISTNERCPLTSYVILGFSQGAVIAGDLASNIGNGRGVLDPGDADLVLGVGMIADGRRVADQQNNVGPVPGGVGAEVALSGMGRIIPGIALMGPRNGGFGELRERTYSLCAPGDLVCDSPTVEDPIAAIRQLSQALNNPVHAMYATTRYWQQDGASATQWMYGWSAELIRNAPQPPHS